MAKQASLWEHFQKLKSAKQGSSMFEGQLLPGRKSDYLAKGSSGEPILLLRAWSKKSDRVPVQLKNLQIEYQLSCKIRSESGKTDSGEFVRIACVAEEEMLHRLFISAGEAILGTLPPAPSESQIYRAVEMFAELFSALARPSLRSVKGLWGELFVICKSERPADMVMAWHIDPEEKYDFSNGAVHLEVKVSESAQRVHEFSLGQLRSPGSATIFVASILMQRSSGGPGVLDLAQQITKDLSGAPELKAKLWANIAKCLGRDFDSASDTRFDKEFSDATFRVVRANDVPCILLPLPTDVLDARLKVSLDIVAGKKPVAWHAVQMSLRTKK